MQTATNYDYQSMCKTYGAWWMNRQIVALEKARDLLSPSWASWEDRWDALETISAPDSSSKMEMQS